MIELPLLAKPRKNDQGIEYSKLITHVKMKQNVSIYKHLALHKTSYPDGYSTQKKFIGDLLSIKVAIRRLK